MHLFPPTYLLDAKRNRAEEDQWRRVPDALAHQSLLLCTSCVALFTLSTALLLSSPCSPLPCPIQEEEPQQLSHGQGRRGTSGVNNLWATPTWSETGERRRRSKPVCRGHQQESHPAQPFSQCQGSRREENGKADLFLQIFFSLRSGTFCFVSIAVSAPKNDTHHLATSYPHWERHAELPRRRERQTDASVTAFSKRHSEVAFQMPSESSVERPAERKRMLR